MFKKKTREVLFSSSLNRFIRNFFVSVAVLFGIRALMFTKSNPLWDFAQPDDLTSKKIFFLTLRVMSLVSFMPILFLPVTVESHSN